MMTFELMKQFQRQRRTRLVTAQRELKKLQTRRYCIKLQWRRPDGPRKPIENTKYPWRQYQESWRRWRQFAVIPILFHTREEAEIYMHHVDVFKNLQHCRKLSASIEIVKLKPPKDIP